MNLNEYLQTRRKADLARALNLSPVLVTQWTREDNPREIPPGRAIDISRATDWQVTPHDLRPDIYPHPTDGLPEHLRCGCWPDGLEHPGEAA